MAIETLYSKDMTQWYDLLYCDEKRTTIQVKFLTKLFKKYHVKSVLDVACGTGRHTIALKKKGYDITGIDLEPAMISYAKENAIKNNLKIDFFTQDMRNIKLNKKFDAVMIMYTSFAYLTSNEDVLRALKSIYTHLQKNGIIIIDTFFAWPKLVKKEGLKTKLISKMKKGNMRYETADKNSIDFVYNYLYTLATHKREIGSKKLPVLQDKKPTKLRLFIPNELDLFFRLTDMTSSWP